MLVYSSATENYQITYLNIQFTINFNIIHWRCNMDVFYASGLKLSATFSVDWYMMFVRDQYLGYKLSLDNYSNFVL